MTDVGLSLSPHSRKVRASILSQDDLCQRLREFRQAWDELTTCPG